MRILFGAEPVLNCDGQYITGPDRLSADSAGTKLALPNTRRCSAADFSTAPATIEASASMAAMLRIPTPDRPAPMVQPSARTPPMKPTPKPDSIAVPATDQNSIFVAGSVNARLYSAIGPNSSNRT